ncbi:unnamed protein product [Orchesella dallaii]|uniref:F-box domain-containing protein n=1 Tax=Orchesella dallaii TaxID=48710 RepID=A0ABP1RJ09_9HEXA
MTSELKSVRLPCREIFPIEVWDCIIRTLRHSFPVLLNCRLVCHDWRKITDKVLQQGGLLWNPEFSRNTGEDEETYKEQMKGTRFNSASSIQKFISFASRSSPLLGSNRFPLHSIVIFPTSHDHSDLYLKVPLLLSQFGDEVWHCTYYVNECIPQSILALPVIFQLENLKSLTLLSYDWSRGEIEDALKRLDINSKLKNLTQVNILGEHAIIPLSILILPNYGSQLKQLYFFCDNDQDQVETMREKGYSYNVGKYLPNMEKFKVFQPNSELLLSLKECSELKSLSLKSKSQSTANINLEDLMGGLNALCGKVDFASSSNGTGKTGDKSGC